MFTPGAKPFFRRPNAQRFTAPRKARPKASAASSVPMSMLELLEAFDQWIESGACNIKDQDTGEVIQLKPNRMQRIILERWKKQATEGKPVRVIVLKARKAGVSTLVQAFFFFAAARLSNMVACTIAHTAISVESIFRITRRIADGSKERIYPTTKQLRFTGNGSLYYCSWAGGNSIISGDTVNFLHCSEAAKWPSPQGMENATSAINAVPLSELTAIIFESTAKGRDPLFWHRWEQSSKPDSPYEAVFIPWFLDDRLHRPVPPDFARTDDERDVTDCAAAWGVALSDEALQWRREKVAELTSLTLFKQEFPSTPEEAVQASEGLVYPDFDRLIVDALPPGVEFGIRLGGIDVGHTHPSVVLDARMVGDQIFVTRAWRKAGALYSEHVDQMSAGTTYYCDPSAAQAILEYNIALGRKSNGARVISCPRHKGEGPGSIVNSEAWLVRRMMAQGRLKVLASAAAQLKLEAENLFWDMDTEKPNNAYRDDVGHFDSLDALRYLCVGAEALGDSRYEGRSGGRRESLQLAACL